MINLITNDKVLKYFLHYNIEDAGVSVKVNEKLSTKEYVGIKVDDYYNSLKLERTPKSVDFIITVDCRCNSYLLYILEFKKLNKPSHLKVNDILEKITNTVNDFIEDRFKHIFLNDKFKYKNVLIYLVGNIYSPAKLKTRNYDRDTLKIDTNLTLNPIRFRGKFYKVNYCLPEDLVVDKIT